VTTVLSIIKVFHQRYIEVTMNTQYFNPTQIQTSRCVVLPIFEFSPRIMNLIQQMHQPRMSGMAFRYPYRLDIKQRQKLADCSPDVKWTAFINEVGNVVNLMCPEFLVTIQLKFTKPLYNLQEREMFEAILERVVRCVKI